jgi:hypothetical protein
MITLARTSIVALSLAVTLSWATPALGFDPTAGGCTRVREQRAQACAQGLNSDAGLCGKIVLDCPRQSGCEATACEQGETACESAAAIHCAQSVASDCAALSAKHCTAGACAAAIKCDYESETTYADPGKLAGACAATKQRECKTNAEQAASTECSDAACPAKQRPCNSECESGKKRCASQACAARQAEAACEPQSQAARDIMRLMDSLQAHGGEGIHCPGLTVDETVTEQREVHARRAQLIQVLENLSDADRPESETLPVELEELAPGEEVTEEVEFADTAPAVQTEALRYSSASLEHTAAELEAAELYEDADLVREIAGQMRHKARRVAGRQLRRSTY